MSLYSSTQRLLRFGFWFYYHKVHIINSHNFPQNVPVLLVANHPNSFMDALLIGAYLPLPTHFLARGDAFKNPILAKIFKVFKMLPVYRISEGKENIDKNFETFDVSYESILKGDTVLLFGEGLCKNNWDLRPLKKGPARIAYRAWNSTSIMGNRMVLIPVGLTYEHYEGGGKSVIVHYGTPISREDMGNTLSSANFVKLLNAKIEQSLKEIAYINPQLSSGSKEHQMFMNKWQQAEKDNRDVLIALGQDTKNEPSKSKRWLTNIHLGVLGLPHYFLMKWLTHKLTKGTVFYDSILFGLTLFLFPFYWFTLFALICYFI